MDSWRATYGDGHKPGALHYLDDVPPAEFEAAFYATQQADHPMVGIK
jgi:putative transposase